MNLQYKITDLVIMIFLLLSFPSVKAQKSNTNQPNVLVIYTDDHRYTGIHALGNQQVETPHMDNLVNEGVSFSNTYLMGAFSGATCIPSRAMLLSGRNLFDLEGQGHVIPKEHITIGETFKKAGYYTHIVGKWHQDNKSLSRSFDSGDRIMGRGVYLTDHFRMPLWDWDKRGEYKKDDAYLLIYNNKGELVRRALNTKDKRGPIGTENNGPHTSEIFAESASEFITNYDKKQPFFMYLAFHAPHDPRQAPEVYRNKYQTENIKLPPSYMMQHPFDNGNMVLRDEELAPWPRTKIVAQQHLADYYAIITHLDTQIGKVIEALKESGDYKNTLIVLAGDSGLAVGNHGLIGKQNIYDEDGVHVPFILAGGVIKNKGKKIETYNYIHDIFPTICEITNVAIPNSVTGKSLLPVIKQETTEHRKTTYHAYKQFQRAYRKGEYKLIEYVRAKDFNKRKGEFESGSRVTQLFNVKKDPWETIDLSFQPKHKELLNQMKREMKDKAIELGDKKENIYGEKYDFWDYYY
ncbi:sulfatase-like hydrolase/transferase [Aquimarina algiphila]|uniref:Sulfatase-like hydrolase/transferase n=1 Tax=Aquimarina algiphila TaxID=2047982 RepID=A0A554VQG0_9FLAO|nr:sulfatase-like hydrolase/transferase [Aquimarina algiphila]TSE10774.1 sulfatase-like hydrolase/transferase [Aquimarina algiphila]